MVGRGEVDLAARQAHFSFEPASEFSLSVEVVIDGDDSYFRYPGAGIDGFELGWLASDPPRADTQFGVSVDSFALLDPRRLLGLIELAEAVSSAGSEQVRGRDAARYRLVLDPIKFYSHIGEVTDGERLSRELQQRRIDSVDLDAWVDDADRVVRFRISVPALCGGENTTELEFFEFDQPLDVVVPSSEDVQRGESDTGDEPEPCPPPDPRDDPVPLGESGDVVGWTASVAEVNFDAGAELEAGNDRHDSPPTFLAEIAIRLRLTYTGDDPTAPLHQLQFSAATDTGVYNAFEHSCDSALPDELDYGDEVAAGTTIERSICRIVPVDEVASLLLLVNEAFNSEPQELYFAVAE